MSAAEVADAAFGRWPGILIELGIDPIFLVDRHGPCPICGGTDRFRFDDKGNGFWFCNQCTAKGGGRPDGFTLLQKKHGWTFSETLKKVAEVAGAALASPPPRAEKTDAEKAADCRRLLMEASPVGDSGPVADYLRARCGDLPAEWLRDLRQHPGLRHPDGGTHPALLEIWRRPDGRGGSVQRVYLGPGGRKADVGRDRVRLLMPGRLDGGGAVRLGPACREMGIAEGVETALCAGKMCGHTVWAALNANLLKAWEPPPNVEMVRIFADNDASFTGQEAAYGLAKRLKQKGLSVEVCIPPSINTDFADVYAAK